MDHLSWKPLQHQGRIRPACFVCKKTHNQKQDTTRLSSGEASASKKARHSRQVHRIHSAAVEEMTETEVEDTLQGMMLASSARQHHVESPAILIQVALPYKGRVFQQWKAYRESMFSSNWLPQTATLDAVSSITVAPVDSLSGHVILPGSKSMTNRVVLLAALSEGISGIQNVLVSHTRSLK